MGRGCGGHWGSGRPCSCCRPSARSHVEAVRPGSQRAWVLAGGLWTRLPERRCGGGASGRGVESAAPPASRGFQQAVGSLRWKLVEPVALRSLSTCAPACGTGGRIPAAAEAEGWGKGRGAPGQGGGGQNTPPSHKLERARNSDGTLRRPPEMRAARCGLGLGLRTGEGKGREPSAARGQSREVSSQSGRPWGGRGTLETETAGKGRWRRGKSQESADLLPAGPCPSPASRGAVFWAGVLAGR